LQQQVFLYRPDVLAVAQPTAPKHWTNVSICSASDIHHTSITMILTATACCTDLSKLADGLLKLTVKGKLSNKLFDVGQ